MITTDLALSEGMNTKLAIASAAVGLSSSEFIRAAVDTALMACAEADRRLDLAFTAIDKRDVPS